MKDTKLELIVGVFVLIGIAALAYLAIKLGKLEVVGTHQRHVQAVFDSVAGLKMGAPVEVAGVQVGQVKRIALDGEHALVTLAVNPDIKVYQDAIGDKYVSLSPGGSDKELPPGGKIRDTESGVDLEAVIGEFIHGSAGSTGSGEKGKSDGGSKSSK